MRTKVGRGERGSVDGAGGLGRAGRVQDSGRIQRGGVLGGVAEGRGQMADGRWATDGSGLD